MQHYHHVPRHISIYLFIGIALGALFGLYYGVNTEILLPLESTFNMFIQTLFVFYIPLSLMYGISSLHAKESGRLLFKAVFFIFLLWTAIVLSCFLASLFLPETLPSIINVNQKTQGLYEKFLEYLVPENPFYDAIHNILPPLAIFSLLLGVAYMRSKDKEPLLDVMQVGCHLLEAMFIWMAYMAPVLAFIHVSIIVGTVDFTVWNHFTFHIAIAIAICLFFSLFFLPMLVSLLTPLPFRVLVRRFAFIGLAGFGTAQPLIVFPFIAHILREIRLKYDFPVRDWQATFLMIAPLSFSFAQLGNIIALFFVLYFGYFFHISFTPIEKMFLPIYAIVLSISSSGLTQDTLTVLAKQFGLPEETLYFIPKLRNFVQNFRILLNSSGIVCLILIVMMLHEKKLKKIGKKATAFLFISGILLTSIFYSIYLVFPVTDSYQELIAPRTLSNSIEHLPKISISSLPENPLPIPLCEGSILNKVLSTRKLTVGFDTHNAPYSYFDEHGCIAGFDIAYMAQLAYDLDVELELIPINFDTMERDLNNGFYDIAVGGILMDFTRIQRLAFTDFYHQDHNVLIVPRDDASKYTNLLRLELQKNLRIGATGIFVRLAKNLFPFSQVYPDADWNDLLENRVDVCLDARITSTLWALKYPGIVGIDFGEVLGKEFVCYALPLHDRAWKRFINQWLSLYKLSGFYNEQYNYWFLQESL
jgi:Na+/H+-dicarboxylate symporter